MPAWITQREHARTLRALEQAETELILNGSAAVREAISDAVHMLARYRRECDHHIAKRREQADTIDNKLADLSRRLDEQ